MMQIRNFEPMPSRPCQYCLALQDNSVFVDFDIDQNGCLYIVRISFDGYGCCTINPKKTKKLNSKKSKKLIRIIEENKLATPEASQILSTYFYENRELLWEDALNEHYLI